MSYSLFISCVHKPNEVCLLDSIPGAPETGRDGVPGLRRRLPKVPDTSLYPSAAIATLRYRQGFSGAIT